MVADGSRPMPRRYLNSPEARPLRPFRVPGPRSLQPRRVYTPVLKIDEDEATAEIRQPYGPRIIISSLSSDDALSYVSVSSQVILSNR